MSILTVSTLFALATSAPIKPEKRIVNGVPVSANTYPWMVSMRKHYLIGNTTYDSGSFCGASLIGVNPPVILTAAHCVDTVQPWTINGTSYEYIGNYTIPVTFHVDINRTDPDEDMGDDSWQTLEWTADQVTVHPLYNTSLIPLGYDIALIVINGSQNLNFSEDDLPQIPTTTLDFSESCCADGDALEAIGYGLNHSNGSGTDTLEHTDLEFVNASYCYDTILNETIAAIFDIDNRVVCAIGNKTDTCQGDSGGPLFRLTSDGEPEIIGLTSWGLGCAVPDIPAVYTSVAHFYDWISDTAGWTTAPSVSPTTAAPTGATSNPTSGPSASPSLPTAVPTASPTGPTASPTDYPVMMTTIDSGSGDSDSEDQSGTIKAMHCGLLVFVVLISAASM